MESWETLFSWKKVVSSFLVVASSAMALAPFSQYSAIVLRSSSGSGHAQPGQSIPPFWLRFASAFNPRPSPISPNTCFAEEITAGVPAATFFGFVVFRPVNFAGAVGLGFDFSGLFAIIFWLLPQGWGNCRIGPPCAHPNKQNPFPVIDSVPGHRLKPSCFHSLPARYPAILYFHS